MKPSVVITLSFRYTDGQVEYKKFSVDPELALYIQDQEEQYCDLEEDYYKLEEMCTMQRLVLEGIRATN